MRAKTDGVGSAAGTPPGAAVAASASRTSVASGPPAASPAAASHHGDAGRRSLLPSIGDGPSLGGVDGLQAVSSDGEGSQILGIYLPQLCHQGLWETLHEEEVEGGVPLHPQRAELQHPVQQLAGLPSSHRLHLDQHIKLLIVGEYIDVQQLVLEVLVLALLWQCVHNVNHLGDHLSRDS
jgi:hypothetical protein